MTGQDNHKIFTAADIGRYLNGQMSAAEMFAIESAALEDPFLADAIEGFDNTRTQADSNLAEDVKELHQRLRERMAAGERRPVPLFLRRNIAAILILLAGLGTMVYYLVEKSAGDRTYISQRESSPTNLQDSISTTTAPAEDLRTRELNKNQNPVTGPEVSQQSPKQKAEDASSQALVRQPAPVSAKRQSSPAETISPEFKKDIGYSSTNKPGPGVASAGAKNSRASRQVAGFDTTNINEDVTDENKVATERSPAAPAEEFQLRDSTPSKEMKTANSTASREKKQAPQVSSRRVAAATPVVGWKAYEVYLQDNKKLPPSFKNIHGKVVLSFSIGQNGKPGNFRIVQSLNKTIDEEAIRLVKDGPLWTATGSPVRTTINF